MKNRTRKDSNLIRENKKTILFNHLEIMAIEKFCKQFKIKNRSRFMREAIITEVLRKFDENYPSLFESQLTLFDNK